MYSIIQAKSSVSTNIMKFGIFKYGFQSNRPFCLRTTTPTDEHKVSSASGFGLKGFASITEHISQLKTRKRNWLLQIRIWSMELQRIRTSIYKMSANHEEEEEEEEEI